ncbi:MAG TPA: glycosyltransferase [Aggregatilineales bacterium]|nr:glycosyltransferase [Anaerolineales bacterium]HRE46497.1 glycosyltransferase [Aggregatilineales bacterium]
MSRRILHLIGQLERGGAERQLLYLVEALQKRGWRGGILSFSRGEAWDDRARALGVPLYFVPRTRHKWLRVILVRAQIARFRPALCHSWSIHTNLYLDYAARLWRGKTLYSFRYDPKTDAHTGQIAKIQYPAIYARTDCVISNAAVSIESARDAGIAMRRVEIIGNIVPLPPAPSERPMTIPRLAAIGLLIPRKGYDVLIDALGLLRAEGMIAELHLAGGGAEREALERQARRQGVAEQVTFLGEIDTVPDLLQSAHILVHPSRAEGLSNTILEGMAAGLPVVTTTAVGGEIIDHERTGLLVPPDDPAALAAALRRLIGDAHLRERLGQAARAEIAARFAPDEVANQVEAIYTSLLENA